MFPLSLVQNFLLSLDGTRKRHRATAEQHRALRERRLAVARPPCQTPRAVKWPPCMMTGAIGRGASGRFCRRAAQVSRTSPAEKKRKGAVYVSCAVQNGTVPQHTMHKNQNEIFISFFACFSFWLRIRSLHSIVGRRRSLAADKPVYTMRLLIVSIVAGGVRAAYNAVGTNANVCTTPGYCTVTRSVGPGISECKAIMCAVTSCGGTGSATSTTDAARVSTRGLKPGLSGACSSLLLNPRADESIV